MSALSWFYDDGRDLWPSPQFDHALPSTCHECPLSRRLASNAGSMARHQQSWKNKLVRATPIANMTTAVEPLSVESARQAFDAIRGYEYQILAATLAWVDLDQDGLLYLEVAEDYATAVGPALEAVQVKDTRSSGSVTLNTPAVRKAIESFVDLTERNPDRQVQLRFFTTSQIGLESAGKDRPGGLPGLIYWDRVRADTEEVGPLRSILERQPYSAAVRTFCSSRSDQQLIVDLVRRVSWDCGRPQTASLRQELEQRLARVLRPNFDVPPQEAPRVADILAYRVLHRSAMRDAQDRVLSHSELRQLVEFATSVNVPRSGFDLLLRLAATNAPQLGPGQSVATTQGHDDPAWVVNTSNMPELKVLVPRPAVVDAARSALKATGICFIVGPTGIGKSTVARTVANTYSHGVRWIDLRDVDSLEARERLNQLLGLLAGMGSSTIMVEDLNCIVAPRVQVALGQVVEAVKRHGMRILVTCYRRPPMTVLFGVGAELGSIVTCPAFELEESSVLVSELGGDPSVWGQVAHIAGGSGHPQLTHTFVASMAARDWPVDEIEQIVKRGFASPDLDDARDAARACMVETLREPVRHLLYRLSIASAPFKRSLALALGTVTPSIERPGECFDELVGPWVEATTPNRYRASPLVRGFGQDVLTAEEQRQVHRMIAEQTISHSPIAAEDIDIVLVHGLAGESHASLFKLSGAVSIADEKTRRALAMHAPVFAMLDTSKPTCPRHVQTSVMLRLAQLRLAIASDKQDGIEDVVHALLRELDAVPNDVAGPYLESIVLLSVLSNIGIANHIPDWFGRLWRFRQLERSNDEGVLSPHPEVPTAAALFGIGTAGLASVEKLAAIFEDLDALPPDERQQLLVPIDPAHADYHLLVHGPWTAQSRQRGVDTARAVASYEIMARQAESWGERTLGLQCCVAIAMIQDELVSDLALALRSLKQATSTFGEDPILSRAFAKLHHRGGEIEQALAFYRDSLPNGEMGPVDATYIIRDASVCAARCGEWVTAKAWFLRAQAAAEPLDEIGLGAIKIGLGADAGVASFEAGDLRDALQLLKNALLALDDLDPDSNLQAAHCHRVVRHAVLWLKSKVGQQNIKVRGEPITMLYGACSNPEPVPEIEELPLGHIDFAWYMLAELELVAGLDLGIREVVRRRGASGQVPLQELALRLQTLGIAIERLDPTSFSKHLPDYVAASAYCHVNRSSLRDSLDVMNPQRVVIPAISAEGAHDPYTENAARHAILAYGVRCLLNGHPRAVFQVRDSLTDTLGHDFPGQSLFDEWTSLDIGRPNLDDEVAAILAYCSESDRPPPDKLFLFGVRFLDWIVQSSFKPFVVRDLGPWLRDQWRRVLQTQRFLLVSPATSVPAIQDVLQSRAKGEQFAARLALATADAVRANLAGGLREHLVALASGASD